MKKCSIEGCQKEERARGWCPTHWARWRYNGSPYKVKERSEYMLRGKEHPHYKHGCFSNPLYCVWSGMMNRCYSKKCESYKRYGGRGIKVCKRWHDIRVFIKDLPPRSQGLTLERINNMKGYSPANCKWATRAEQSRNRRTTKLNPQKVEEIKNMRKTGMTVIEIARIYGVYFGTVKKIIAGKIWYQG